MKSKILIFLFTILTFGLFLIPKTFAKSYNTSVLNNVNRIDNIVYWDYDSHIDIYLNLKDLNNSNGYWYFTYAFYNSDFNIVDYSSSINLVEQYITKTYGGTDVKSFPKFSNQNRGWCYYSDLSVDNYNGVIYSYHLLFRFSNVDTYNSIKNNTSYIMGMATRSSSNNLHVPINTIFVGNNLYYSSFRDLGVFNSSSVQLRRTGSNSYTDISDSCLYYNAFRFNNEYVNLINNTNNVNSNGNYYIRFYFNNKIKNLSNFNLSYVELMSMSANNSYYSDLTSIRNALPIINNGITLYNDNTTLFNTNDMVNSGYADFYIEYIDFRIVDYSFKSSSYFNSGLGISGYLSSTKISALSVDALSAYNNGFDAGSRVATEDAYNQGKQDGINSNTTSFDGLMLSVANVPMKIISSMLDFHILGVNLLGFFMGIITLLLFVRLMRKFKE